MSDLLPIIEQLADAPDDATRADWLLRCPLSLLMTYEFTIRNRLRAAGFAGGIDYLDQVLSVLRSVRTGEGDWCGDIYDQAHEDLIEIARAGP